MNARRLPIRPLVLAAAVGISYANAFRGVFQFDDYNVIVGNPAVHSLAAFVADLPTGIRPLLKLSFLVNWTAGGGPFGFHLFNVSLHAVNVLLVYLLAGRMGTGDGFAGGSPQKMVPFLAALLFAVHPVQTEAVTYISGRSMSMMACFYLAGLLSYVRGTSGGKGWLYVASPAFFVLAVLVKETAITLPVALLLWDWSFGTGKRTIRDIVRRQAVHWILLFLFGAGAVLHDTYRELLLYGFGARSMAENLLAQSNGIVYLLSRFFRIDRLNIDPDLPAHVSWSPDLLGKTGCLVGLLLLGVALLRRNPAAGFGLLWFFLQIVPTNSIIPRLDVANERHLYLASWGIFLAVSAGAEGARAYVPGKEGWFRAGWCATLAMLVAFTVSRNEVYRSETALWEETARRSAGKARVHNNLGYAYYRAGQPERSIPEYREALRIDPDHPLARGNLALAEAAMALRGTSFPPR